MKLCPTSNNNNNNNNNYNNSSNNNNKTITISPTTRVDCFSCSDCWPRHSLLCSLANNRTVQKEIQKYQRKYRRKYRNTKGNTEIQKEKLKYQRKCRRKYRITEGNTKILKKIQKNRRKHPQTPARDGGFAGKGLHFCVSTFCAGCGRNFLVVELFLSGFTPEISYDTQKKNPTRVIAKPLKKSILFLKKQKVKYVFL